MECKDGARELYDLKRDPFELRSLHAKRRYARTRQLLRKSLRRLPSCGGADCREATPVS